VTEALTDPAFLTSLGTLTAGAIGFLTFRVTRNRLRADQSSMLFDDAIELSSAYKEAYTLATSEIQGLRLDVQALRGEVTDLIRAGEMWRAAAYRAAEECDDGEGVAPFWWPRGEPLPDVYLDT